VSVVDNAFLDHTSKDAQGWGYTVFGRVVEGMDVVDAIEAEETDSGDRPLKDVSIQSVALED
jgi:peptidyl-prolyl cis-trans isomerase B (cyclophilin B)